MLARRPPFADLPPTNLPATGPAIDDLFDNPTALDWGFVAAVAWFAYRAGQSSKVQKSTPNPTLGAILTSYVGLRALDKLFGVTK